MAALVGGALMVDGMVQTFGILVASAEPKSEKQAEKILTNASNGFQARPRSAMEPLMAATPSDIGSACCTDLPEDPAAVRLSA